MMLQPIKGDTGLEGDMQGCGTADRLEGWTASGGGALDCSGLQCLPDPFGSLIVVRRLSKQEFSANTYGGVHILSRGKSIQGVQRC